ncbi:hypothetical protein HBN50_17060 [Halobacteriovorax sp. GB3]|uniref:hypothetical protein n=1 Tax=Halobacteriovorax sp. GB3 TaxID=2719615 RepID=UPI002360BA5F|nr:hypothetical protein [Halobacteriovorax sp. GB3]MDD0854821.1 hypothetical protein [Halobacteriovorax sp. GB3]
MNEVKIHRPHITLKKDAPKKGQHIDDRQFIPEPYKKVARGMEEQFANFMLQEMEKTTGAKDGSTASDYYKNLMRSKRAEAMALENKLGIQDSILDQIYPKQQRSKAAHDAYLAATSNKFQKSKVEMHDYPKQDIQMARKDSAKELNND